MTTNLFALRPMSTVDILNRTILLYRRHFFHVLATTSLPYVLIVPISLVLGATPRGRSDLIGYPQMAGIAYFAAFGVNAIWLNFVSMGALARSISELYLGRAPRVWTSYSHVLRRSASLLWAYFLGFLGWGGMLALGIAIPTLASSLTKQRDPASWGISLWFIWAVSAALAASGSIVIFFRLLLVTQVIVIEDHRGLAALRRSWRLMRVAGSRAVGTLLFGIVAYLVLSTLLEFCVSLLPEVSLRAVGRVANIVVVHSCSVLSVPLLSIGCTLLYYDSRVRQEAFDAEKMARNLGFPAS